MVAIYKHFLLDLSFPKGRDHAPSTLFADTRLCFVRLRGNQDHATFVRDNHAIDRQRNHKQFPTGGRTEA